MVERADLLSRGTRRVGRFLVLDPRYLAPILAAWGLSLLIFLAGERPGLVVPLLRPVHRDAVGGDGPGLLPGPGRRRCSRFGSFVRPQGHRPRQDPGPGLARPVAPRLHHRATRSSRAGSPSPPAGCSGRARAEQRQPPPGGVDRPDLRGHRRRARSGRRRPPLLFGYLLMVGTGLRIAMRCDRPFEKLLATGLSLILGVQTFVIVGGVTRLIPLTGITLPFVSYGGSSLIANYILLALLLRISHDTETPTPVQTGAARPRCGRRRHEPADPPPRPRHHGPVRGPVRAAQLAAARARPGPRRQSLERAGGRQGVHRQARRHRLGGRRPLWPRRCRPTTSSSTCGSTRRGRCSRRSPGTSRSPTGPTGPSAPTTRCSRARAARSSCRPA